MSAKYYLSTFTSQQTFIADKAPKRTFFVFSYSLSKAFKSKLNINCFMHINYSQCTITEMIHATHLLCPTACGQVDQHLKRFTQAKCLQIKT